MVSLKCMAVADDKGWLGRVKYFMQKSAVAVFKEGEAVANHAERVAYADKILTGEASVSEFSIAAVTNATISTKIDADEEVTDTDLGYVVQTEMYNSMAGIEG